MLSDLVGQQIRVRREQAKLTRDQIAERCATLGWPSLTATVLHNLETGRPDTAGTRRREVTVDELVALAYVLDVPPLVLMAPLDAERWEPPLSWSMNNAVAWLRGDRSASGGPEPAVYSALRLYVQADALAHQVHLLMSEVKPERPPTLDDVETVGPEAAEAVTIQGRRPGWAEQFDARVKELRTVRSQLRAAGLPLPGLRVGMEWVDHG